MKKLFGLLALVLLFAHCTNDTPLPNSYDLLDRDNKVGLMPPVSLKASRVATYWQPEPTGTRTTMLLGARDDLTSYVIFDCQNLIKVDSSAQLLSASMFLFSDTLNETTPLDVSLHQVLTSWGETSVVWDSVADFIEPTPVESFTFQPVNFSWTEVPLNNLEFLQEWIKDSYQPELQIKGLVMKFDQASDVIQMASSDASGSPPYIRVVTQAADDAAPDTTLAYFSRDASLMQFNSEVPAQETDMDPARLRVGNGSGYRSLLHFDLSDIPREASIHKALLRFHVDPMASRTDPQNAMSIAVNMATGDSTWQQAAEVEPNPAYPPTSDIASETQDVFGFDSSTPLKDVSRMVQRLVTEQYPNYGFIIYPENYGLDFQEMAFYSGIADTSSAPTLEIRYSQPPEHRFGE